MNRLTEISGWYMVGIFCLGAAIGIRLSLSFPGSAGMFQWGLFLAGALAMVMHAGAVSGGDPVD